MPTGSSRGRNSSRAARSQTVTKAAPHRAHRGSSFLHSLPANRRTAWGTISPTKPSSPAKLTAPPQSTAASPRNTVRIRPAFRPRLRAVSSPRESTSSSLLRRRNAPSTSRISAPAGISRAETTAPKPPTRKSLPSRAASGKRFVTVSETAPRVAFTATPAKITVVRDAPASFAAKDTASTAANAPRKAAPAIAQPDRKPSAPQTVTARPAPALTPMMLGEARGLHNTFWITQPAVLRAAPASRHAAVRGSRENQKIRPATVSVPPRTA